MDEYQLHLNVDIHDVDYNGVARASSLLRYLQSAAQSQLTDVGLSYDRMKSNNRAFIISRIRIEFFDTVRAYQPLTAISYPCESRGYSFLRCYRLERDGVTIGRAASIWALIDTEKKSLVRVDQFHFPVPVKEPIPDLPIGHIRLPAEMNFVGTYAVRYADVDQNRHMNNTRYLDLFSEFLPMEGKRIAAVTLSYLNEAPLGDELRVERGTVTAEDGATLWYFRTTRSDGQVNAEAEIELCEIE